jgi:pectin methylesterase-like acyl-CoA thioesterase
MQSLGDTSGKWDPFHRPAAAFIRVFMVKAVNSEGKAYSIASALPAALQHTDDKRQHNIFSK